jgi:hypothetical protein
LPAQAPAAAGAWHDPSSGTTGHAAAAGYLQAASRAIAAFLTGHAAGDMEALADSARALCGLGPGLTPAGDDWLAGWMLAQHLLPDIASAAVGAVLGAATATTTLSRAFLECAAAGEADASWHRLLFALAQEDPADVQVAGRAILHHGATSGADMLAGFAAGLGQLCERME